MTEIQDDIADELVRLKAELAAAKAETRRVREQLSLDVAEARVETGRVLRRLNEATRRLRAMEAERNEAAALALNYENARARTVEILNQVIASMASEGPGE